MLLKRKIVSESIDAVKNQKVSSKQNNEGTIARNDDGLMVVGGSVDTRQSIPHKKIVWNTSDIVLLILSF